ncbi:MAG: hypothetical protein ACYDEQ_02495 [Desulfocucumaceae bacterium]
MPLMIIQRKGILLALGGPPISPDNEGMEDAGRWEDFCDGLFRAYQDQALAEIGRPPRISTKTNPD